MVKGLHHVSIIVSNTGRSLKFYHNVLGLAVNYGRPDLGYPGAWLDVGEQQIHLLELSNPDPVSGRPEHGGRDRHIALMVSSLDEIKNLLKKHEITFTVSKSGRSALFCRDPDGNGIELIEI